MKSTELDHDMSLEFRADVRNRLRGWRLRLLWQRLVYTIAAISVLILVGRLRTTPLYTLVQQVLALGLSSFILLWLSQKWRCLTPENFVQHLNRRFPDFEESAQLLLKNTTELSPLQSLQRERALAAYRRNLAQAERWQVPIKYRTAMTVSLSCLLLAFYSDQLISLSGRFIPENLIPSATHSVSKIATGFNSIAVLIKPPAYTGLASIQTDELNLELPEGSRVEWTLSFETNGYEYVLKLSNDRQIALKPAGDGSLHASGIIDKTELYRIVRTNTAVEQTIGDIYTLKVGLDQPPDIRVIKPELSLLEIPKNGPAVFTNQVLVKDDYGVQTVEILASVAKGSGEGVKFRDQKLSFDQSTETDRGLMYQKEWDLQALGMEPGDEVYFTVIATDNRLPQSNVGRSATLIVRWLEDQRAGLAVDGLGIDFIPEYFKSQRQIIIETEQLIEDEAQLPTQVFKDSAYAIGQAQADLKQKYGQYLGDEFGESPGQPTVSEPENDEKAGGAQDHHENEHDTADSGNRNKTLNSTADILKLFGHDHGDPEIGPITQRNPVALMKRAVSEMWQAERHLMQAEPVLALPFEYEAYKYLKLARQADRIYVKRLGFEPPPISEDRRLTGKLDEIHSYRLSAPEQTHDMAGNQWFQSSLKDIYHILKTYSSETKFNEDERALLSRLSQEFTHRSQQRPALIQHAASLEELSLAGHLKMESCDSCLQDLETTVWNLIEEAASQLHQRNSAWYADDGLIQGYQQVLKQSGPAKTDGLDHDGEQR